MSRCSSTVSDWGKERKKGRKLERGNRANRERFNLITDVIRRNSKTRSCRLFYPFRFPDVTRLFVRNVVFLAKKSPFFLSLSFLRSPSSDFYPSSFDRWKASLLPQALENDNYDRCTLWRYKLNQIQSR